MLVEVTVEAVPAACALGNRCFVNGFDPGSQNLAEQVAASGSGSIDDETNRLLKHLLKPNAATKLKVGMCNRL